MWKRLVERVIAAPLVGVDIGSSRLKAIEVEAAGGQWLLRRCAVVAVKDGDSSGALARLVREAEMPEAGVAVGIAAPEVIVKPVRFPPMPNKELAGAIRLEAEAAIFNGHPLSDMAVDWHQGLLAVAPRAILAARLEAVRAAGLHPLVADVEGLALWNAYWALIGAREASPKTVLVVNVGARTTNLALARGPDTLLLIRDLQLGGEALEAGRSSEWVAEVRDSVGYARSHAGLRILDAAYVAGGGSGPALLPLLQAAVNCPATLWNPLHQLARDGKSPPVEASQGPLLAVALGLALRRNG